MASPTIYDETTTPQKVALAHGNYDSGGGVMKYVPLLVDSTGAIKTNITYKTKWDDIRFPFSARGLFSPSGNLDYNAAELSIDFDNTSTYTANDQVGMICQIQHDWLLGSDLHPHIHWLQDKDVLPNFMIEHRMYKLGETPPAWTQAISGACEFTYVSGTISQICGFPAIDMSGYTDPTDLSIIVDFKFFRDTNNASGLFAGADLYGTVITKEFDVHYQVDSLGSTLEYSK